MRRMGSSCCPGENRAVCPASSTFRTICAATRRTGSMSPTVRTIVSRCSTVTASTKCSGTTCIAPAHCVWGPANHPCSTSANWGLRSLSLCLSQIWARGLASLTIKASFWLVWATLVPAPDCINLSRRMGSLPIRAAIFMSARFPMAHGLERFRERSDRHRSARCASSRRLDEPQLAAPEKYGDGRRKGITVLLQRHVDHYFPAYAPAFAIFLGVRHVLQRIGPIDQRLQPASLHQIGNLRQGMSTRLHESPVISTTESSLFGSPRSEELICLFGAQFEAELIDKPHFRRSDRDVCCLCIDFERI